MKATESRTRAKKDETDSLPRSAAWGHKATASSSSAIIITSSSTARTPRRGTNQRQQQQPRIGPASTEFRRKGSTATKAPSQTSSRPPTPAGVAGLPLRPSSPAETKPSRTKKEHQAESPAPSNTTESEKDSQGATSPVVEPQSVDPLPLPVPSAPPGLPAVPPGLSAPPGIPLSARAPRPGTASPQTPILSSQTSYQMSNTARSLLDDVKARREMPAVYIQSPFPDLDRTLQNLTGGDGAFGSFTFNLDTKLAAGDDGDDPEVPDFDLEAKTPFIGTYMDAFPALRPSGSASTFAPPGLPYPHNPSRSIYDPLAIRPSKADTQSTGGSSYVGSFNPFGENSDEANTVSSSRPSSIDDDTMRRVSRFGFARGRQGSATSCPLNVSSPLSISSTSVNESTHMYYNSADVSHSPAPSQWSLQGYNQPGSNMASPQVPNVQAQPSNYLPASGRFQPFESGVSEAQLRDFIQSSREKASALRNTTGRRLLFV